MSRSGEKHAQDYNLMWCILMALRVIYFWAVIYGTLYLCCELRCAVTWPSLCRPPIHMSACTASPVSLRLRLIWARNLFMVIMVMVMVMVTVMVMVAQVEVGLGKEPVLGHSLGHGEAGRPVHPLAGRVSL